MKKHIKTLVALLALLCFTVSIFAGCSGGTGGDGKASGTTAATSNTASAAASDTPKKDLKIRVVDDEQINTTPLQDNTLEKLVAGTVKEKTGVEAEYSSMPPDTTIAQYLSMINAAGNIPEVLNLRQLSGNGDAMEYVTKNNLVYEITPDMIKKYMPNYAARIEEYGQTVDVISDETKYSDGKNYYINYAFNPSVFPKLRGTGIEKLWGTSTKLYIYHVYLRDDILKKIFPNARSEAAMKQLYLEKGTLTVDDIIGDIPIQNMEDMDNYLKKVQELNLKVGDKQVIPGALNASSQSVNSVFWSLHTATGLLYRWPLIYNNPPETSYFAQTSDKAKDYIYWLNKMYNGKLMDPEIFIMKDDQYRAKAINGEYAVINCWLPVDQAKSVGKERGYGYRYFPVFYPVDRSVLNNQINHVGVKNWSVAFSKTIKEEDLPQVLAWADFFFSKESDELAYWGSPDWYTGEGKDRRYKPEYKELEDWAVYRKSGGKDGAYYGVINNCGEMEYGSGIRASIQPMNFFGFSSGYPEAPYYVYEKDPAKASDVDVGTVSHNILMKDNDSQMKIYLEKGWSQKDLENIPAWAEMSTNTESKDISGLLIKAIVGSESKFSSNWDTYVKGYNDCGLEKAVKAVQEEFKDIYNNKLLPNEIK